MTRTSAEAMREHAVDETGESTARDHIMRTLGSVRAVQALYVAVRLGLPDELDTTPRSAAELAAAGGGDPDAVHRLLRALASIGVVEACPPDRWKASPGSELLRSDRADSLRSLVLFNASPTIWAAFGALEQAVTSGRPGFDSAVGRPVREHAQRDAAFGAVLDDAMRALNAQNSSAYRKSLTFDPGTHLVDVGGGTGSLLAHTLTDNPGTTGTLVDRADVLDRAETELADNPSRSRMRLYPADATRDELPSADVYLLKTLLHLYADDSAGAVLDRIRDAAPPRARLLILERVLAEPGSPDPGALLDLDMLTVYGGRDRTVDEWDTLLERHGWQRSNEPTAGNWTVVAALPLER